MARNLFHSLSLLGTVTEISPDGDYFILRTRSEDDFLVYPSTETYYKTLTNLDEVNRDRYGPPIINGKPAPNPTNAKESIRNKIYQYITPGALVATEGTYYVNALSRRYEPVTIHALYEQQNKSIAEHKGHLLFESPQWWLSQITNLADGWLQGLFPDQSDANEYDFDYYATKLDFTFKREEGEKRQESATLSRLIYGLSSAFLLIGSVKYFDAAKAGVAYLRKHFRIPLSNGHEILWAHAKTHSKLFIESLNDEDLNSIPLYEQIYVLAGLTQFYRITNDEDVLEDIIQTVRSFQHYYKDPDTSRGGWFSHLDYSTFTYDSPTLDIRQNSARKNWNSIGDHIPAYLVNVLLSLNPLPPHLNNPDIIKFLEIAKDILKESTHLIVTKFPEPNNNYVQERFYADWTPDRTHTWQQNRAVVGHNLKIAWNLTRVANYYLLHPEEGVDVAPLLAVAERLAKAMINVGAVDLFRGGCYDCVEREPSNGFPIQFTWRNTKDFWQQEQGILAYYIVYGFTREKSYLDYARDMASFWNIFFLDHAEQGVFFRTTDDGLPYVKDGYGDKAGHAIAGYHAFELSYLSHVYTASYVSQKEFTIYYKPDQTGNTEFNVLPDNIKPNTVAVIRVTVNGLAVPLPSTGHPYTIHLRDIPAGATFAVTFAPKVTPELYVAPIVPAKGKIGVLVESHFDETEVRRFNEFFPKNGYEVEYITYLWGASKVTYAGNDHADQLVVRKDFADVNIADYKGFILIGGYATDRLRYEAPPRPIEGEPNHSKAVDFLRKILVVPGLKIGTICHSLWLFTVDPTLIQGRKVVAAPNILYDVINAGATIVYNENGQGTKHVVVDGDLISAAHPDYVQEFVEAYLAELEKHHHHEHK